MGGSAPVSVWAAEAAEATIRVKLRQGRNDEVVLEVPPTWCGDGSRSLWVMIARGPWPRSSDADDSPPTRGTTARVAADQRSNDRVSSPQVPASSPLSIYVDRVASPQHIRDPRRPLLRAARRWPHAGAGGATERDGTEGGRLNGTERNATVLEALTAARMRPQPPHHMPTRVTLETRMLHVDVHRYAHSAHGGPRLGSCRR